MRVDPDSIASISLRLGIVMSLALATGCAGRYYGYTETQWRNLNADQRETAIRDFDAIRKAERERVHRERFIEPVKQTVIDRGIEKVAP